MSVITDTANSGGWSLRGVELPHGEDPDDWWIDGAGATHRGRRGGEELPGRFFLSGMVDAHAHPATAVGPLGPAALSAEQAQRVLLGWAESGVALVRDVGSPGGVCLDVSVGDRMPRLLAAGRFLAPEGRYFPDLLVEPVAEDQLVAAALAEVARGAPWVKVIADFPSVPEMTGNAQTYSTALIAELCTAIHVAGARVAVHCTTPIAGDLVAAGVDSVEHGTALDLPALELMAARGVAWTPTLCAVAGALDDPDLPDERRAAAEEALSSLTGLLPTAVRLGVPVLAGTDVVGTLPREVAMLIRCGVEPKDALAAASTTARAFLGEPARADVVTFDVDPREDPGVLARPAAVVIGGIRLR